MAFDCRAEEKDPDLDHLDILDPGVGNSREVAVHKACLGSQGMLEDRRGIREAARLGREEIADASEEAHEVESGLGPH